MVFSSVPLYLDPPNWQQQNPNNGEAQISQQLMESGRPIRAAEPTSMTERARQAKIPMPEGPLKCPRCDSQNTKFCYFNNYNLSQPRHFCKTCRRYWTRGGSLRNVPVGGGCRRNKRKRSSKRQKSPAPAAQPEPRPEPPPAPEQFMAPPPQFSFMASLQSLMTSQIGMGSYGGGFGSSSTMYPYQNNNSYNNNTAIGGGETVSYGKGLNLMEQMRGGELNLMNKQYNGTTATTEDDVAVSQQQLLWNSSSNGGLWTDFSGIGSSSSTTPMNNVLR